MQAGYRSDRTGTNLIASAGISRSEDQSIPVDTVNQFEAALNAINVTNEIYIEWATVYKPI